MLAFVLLAVLCAPVAPLFDPDEGYYPATAAETLRSGSFWDPRFNDAPRWDKPILSYALIEASFELLGVNAAAARLPSALEGAALIAIVGVLVARLTTVRAGTLCAVAVATTLGMSTYSRVAHPEIAVVLSIVTSELLLAHWLTASTRRHRRIVALLIGASVGYGLLAKGPVAVVLPVLGVLGSLPFITMPRGVTAAAIGDAALAGTIAIAIAAPWYVAMSFRHGWPFLENALWRQNVARYSTPTYGHHASVFFLILPTLIALFPWVAALPAALGRIRATANGNRDVLRTVMLASAVTALVFYSLSTSKLAGYVLVCIPSLAVVVGLMLDDDFDDATAIARTARRTGLLLAICAAGLVISPLAVSRVLTTRKLLGGIRPSTTDVAALIGPVTISLGLFLVAGALFVVLARSSPWRVVAISVVGALVPVVVLVAARPLLFDMYPWETFGRAIAARPAPVWLLGRRAPSLTFYSHHAITLVPTVESLEAGLASQATAWVAFTREDWTRLSPAGILAGKHGTVVAEGGRMVLVCFSETALSCQP